MLVGMGTMVCAGVCLATGIMGVRAGRRTARWTAFVALAGAGLAAGGLLVQHDPDLASWLIAPPVGAVLATANVRALFGPGRRFPR